MLCFTFNSCLSCFITGHLLNIYLNEREINAELKPRYIKKNGKKTVKIKSDGSRSAGRFRLLFHLFNYSPHERIVDLLNLFYCSPHERIVDLLNFSLLQKKKKKKNNTKTVTKRKVDSGARL